MNVLEIVASILVFLVNKTFGQSMKCSYGPRGSLTSICENATAPFFKSTSYRFDELDQTVICKNCNLNQIASNTFDLFQNEILTLDISNSKVRILEKKAFVGLVYATKLLLQNNNIELIVPETFQGVKMLEVLNLANNSIRHIVNHGFLELENLQELNVGYNKITVVDNDGFEGLSILKELNLEHNLIESPCGWFSPLKKISIINLSNNRVSSIPSYCFIDLPKLSELYLGGNLIATISQVAFSGVNDLKLLDLSSNGLRSVDAAAFSKLYSLEVLLLGHNNMTNVQVFLIRGVHFLRDLDLSDNKISDFKTGYFKGVPELRFLNLSNNRIERLEKTGILALPNLHTLDFNNNKIEEIDYKNMFTHIPRIQSLYLRSNPIPCYEIIGMTKFFDSQDVRVFVDKFDQPCNFTNTEEDTTNSEDSFVETSAASCGYIDDIITLTVFVIFILMCLLFSFFWQYRSSKSIKKIIEEENPVKAQLISSSQLEGRDY